jgi:hypothetical protein
VKRNVESGTTPVWARYRTARQGASDAISPIAELPKSAAAMVISCRS